MVDFNSLFNVNKGDSRKLGKSVPYNDYSEKMNDLVFVYDESYTNNDDLPDPQQDPILVGARIPIRKVGISPVDLPIIVKRRDGNTQQLQAECSLYCSLDDPNAKGLNLSRLYLLMYDKIKDHLTIDGIKGVLKELADKQQSKSAYCKIRFKYPMTQNALRSKNQLGDLLRGHITYKTEIEGRYINGQYKFYLTVDYVYSSTCPCSFELAHHATTTRGVAANAHSQRSVAKVTIEFDSNNIVWIEDVVDLLRFVIPTEVQIVVKRADEQAFAERNGSNLLFAEDACRLIYQALDVWYQQKRIFDFNIVIEHIESLHPWSAIAVTSKFDDSINHYLR